MNLIIIRMDGGLGNQMFHYAFYRALREKRQDVYADIYLYSQSSLLRPGNFTHDGYGLKRIFGLEPQVPSWSDVLLRGGCTGSGFLRVVTRWLERHDRLKILEVPHTGIEYNPDYCKLILATEDAYLVSYTQSEKYFYGIREKIRKAFTFPDIDDEKNLTMAQEIQSTNSVSLHVRRGDYVNYSRYGSICQLDYFQRAIKNICERVENPTFFVFSDDIPWCKENLNIPSIRFINHNRGQNYFRDMQLMSLCHHNIIPNSTFAWWGAWLNAHKDKVVICPDRWHMGSVGTGDIVPDEWIKVRASL